MWTWLSGDVTSVSKEVIEMVQAISKPDRAYLSLPRPGVSVKCQQSKRYYKPNSIGVYLCVCSSSFFLF